MMCATVILEFCGIRLAVQSWRRRRRRRRRGSRRYDIIRAAQTEPTMLQNNDESMGKLECNTVVTHVDTCAGDVPVSKYLALEEKSVLYGLVLAESATHDGWSIVKHPPNTDLLHAVFQPHNLSAFGMMVLSNAKVRKVTVDRSQFERPVSGKVLPLLALVACITFLQRYVDALASRDADTRIRVVTLSQRTD